MHFIDTHTHLDGKEFSDDLDLVVARAQEAGVAKVFVPAIDLSSVDTVFALCRRFAGYAYPMMGLHPEEVRSDWREVLCQLKSSLNGIIAIGEVGLDFYWSREFEQEQLQAFEEQVRWAVELHLPLMIHCRKAQNELVSILKRYRNDLSGGVFHCFTGNAHEAEELLQFEGFALGIGGVLTFKKSNLPDTLVSASGAAGVPTVPLDRIVLETDSPYMAPVPHRGQRNEPAFVREVLLKLADIYQVPPETVAQQTNDTVRRIFGVEV